ncbi:MAG: glycosyltransferase family 4 protein [Anaerolineae bacterium]
MKIFALSTWFPHPPSNGSRIRAYNLLKAMAARHEVSLISFVRDEEGRDPGDLHELCTSVETVPWIEFVPGRARAVLGYLSTEPRSVVDTYSEEMARLVSERLAGCRTDLVVAIQAPVAHYVPRATGVPAVVDEIQVAVIKDAAERAAGSLARLRARLTWLKQRHYLMRLLARFDACTVVSEVERFYLRQAVPCYDRVHVIPNGVDVEHNRVSGGPRAADTLIYTGALTYSANYDAVNFFLGDIMPLIQAVNPDVRLIVTGSTRGVALERLPQRPGVTFTGYLDDIRQVVAGSWALVVPLRIGGGTRLKILEAMALGTPVVSTSKGAEGLEVRHDENILIADDPAEFARQTVRLLRDPALRRRLAENGRKLVEDKYSWTEIGRRFNDLLESVVRKRRQP